MNKVDFESYADDNTSYVIGNGGKEFISSLTHFQPVFHF